MGDIPPPAYTADQSATPSSMSYISTRPAPSNPPPSNKIVHKISRPSLSYPTTFAPRDVTLQDWQTFLQHLALPESKPSKVEQRQYNFVLAEWNDEFFAPRGLQVEIVEEQGGVKGTGFKVGNVFVGASWSEGGGYGLKVGDTVLGVKLGESAKVKTDEQPEGIKKESRKIDDKQEGDK